MLGQLRKYVDTDCLKLFFNTHLLAHINYASTVWSNASEGDLKRINSIHRRTATFILPDHSLSTAAKLKKLGILPLQKQFAYNTAVLLIKVHMGWVPHYVCDL